MTSTVARFRNTGAPSGPTGDDAVTICLITSDFTAGQATHRRSLVPTWTDEHSALIVRLVLGYDAEDSALRAFVIGSGYLWATGSWASWLELTESVGERFGLDDIDEVVARAAAAESPDDLGHFACTRVYLDGACGAGRVDADVLLPLCALRTSYIAAYRARRRLAIRRSDSGRSDICGLLETNMRVAVEARDLHRVAENLGDRGFLRREALGPSAVNLVRAGLAARIRTDGSPSAGQAQQLAALALLGGGVSPTAARVFASTVGARHIAGVLDAIAPARVSACLERTSANADAIRSLARIW